MNKMISDIFKILLLYEDKTEEASTSKEEYLTYLKRLYVRFKGRGDSEISDTINGLYRLELENPPDHKTVKTIVFHLIDCVKKGEGGGYS